jgi:phosphoribosylpyrophosphate synthetase
MQVVSIATLLAEAIRRIHHHKSISELFRGPGEEVNS